MQFHIGCAYIYRFVLILTHQQITCMLPIPKNVKIEVFKHIITLQNPFGDGAQDLVDFLNDIWDLRILPSTDGRFKDAYGDAVQHLINNDDWDFEYIFYTRFSILEDDDYFEKFISNFITFHLKVDGSIASQFINSINELITQVGFKLVKSGYDVNYDDLYTIQASNEIAGLPHDVKRNDIKIFVDKHPKGRSDRTSNHLKPQEFPSFVLVYNNGWDDYDVKSSFNLFFHKTNTEVSHLGGVKIMIADQSNIVDALSDNFTMLTTNYCSIGQTLSYYQNMLSIMGSEYESVLFALKDAAIFPKIQEDFEDTSIFKNSLIRDDEAERTLRTVKFSMKGRDLVNLYQFSYMFQPNFADTPVQIDLDFNNRNKNLPDRIFAFIGKNGTGKTQLVTSLPLDIANKVTTKFLPDVPIFSKVIAVSYSAFDHFSVPESSAAFNYVYCGLRNSSSGNNLMSELELTIRFEKTVKDISSKERINRWRSILSNFLHEETIEELFIRLKDSEMKNFDEYKFNMKHFLSFKNQLSSGQRIILYIISEIVSNIRYDSLIIYDEPETHLHPNAITDLMNTIYELVKEFQSYCILATHSPLVIRELMSRNVFVVEKIGNLSSVNKINIECFGENLSVLTDEVFMNKSAKKQYKTIIEELVKKKMSYEEIIFQLESDRALSLNSRLFIASLVEPND